MLPEFPIFANGMPGGRRSYVPLLDTVASGIVETTSFSEPER